MVNNMRRASRRLDGAKAARLLERLNRTNISIKKFILRLERLRTEIIKIAGKEHIAEPEIDIEPQNLVKSLR